MKLIIAAFGFILSAVVYTCMVLGSTIALMLFINAMGNLCLWIVRFVLLPMIAFVIHAFRATFKRARSKKEG